jgi:hypothetical protein
MAMKTTWLTGALCAAALASGLSVAQTPNRTQNASPSTTNAATGSGTNATPAAAPNSATGPAASSPSSAATGPSGNPAAANPSGSPANSSVVAPGRSAGPPTAPGTPATNRSGTDTVNPGSIESTGSVGSANGVSSGITGTSATGSAAGMEQWNQTFKRLDRRSRGFLTRDELQADASLGIDFAQVDRNGDGRVSRAEFQNAYQAGAQGSAGSASPAGTTGTTGVGSSDSTGSVGSSSDRGTTPR